MYLISIIILTILIIFIYRTYYYYPFYSGYIKYSKRYYYNYNNLSLNNVINNYDNELSLNNVINNYNNSKNIQYKKIKNVIFFFSFDYKIKPIYYNKTKESFDKYCNLHGYNFLIFDHSNDQNKISPYWIRVKDLVNLSKNYDSDTVFIYLDIDTYLNPKYLNIKIDKFLNSIDSIENKVSDIYIGHDIHTSSNAGVIIVRNTDWSKQFLNHWWSKYNPQEWTLKNNGWSCIKNNKNCPWAGVGYEQGEFNIIYDTNEINSKDHIKILHSSLISNNNPYIDSFIYHFFTNIHQTYDNKYIK